MPLFAYCITERSANVRIPCRGLGCTKVEHVDNGGLRCFFSGDTNAASILGEPIRQSAMIFHEVLEKVFEQAAIIPFRFPTTFSGQAEIIAFLKEHSEEYSATLKRLRNMVQMEVRVRFKGSPLPSGANRFEIAGEVPVKLSGTEYLRKVRTRRAMTENLAQEVRNKAAPWIKAWRKRDSSDEARCFALIERKSIEDFQRVLKKISLPPSLMARLSGPWPPTQFLKEKEEKTDGTL